MKNHLVWKIFRLISSRKLPLSSFLLERFLPSIKSQISKVPSDNLLLDSCRGLEVDLLGPADRLHFFLKIFVQQKNLGEVRKISLVSNTIVFGRASEIRRTLDQLDTSDHTSVELIRAAQRRTALVKSSSRLKSMLAPLTTKQPGEGRRPDLGLEEDAFDHPTNLTIANLHTFRQNFDGLTAGFSLNDSPDVLGGKLKTTFIEHIRGSLEPVTFIRASDGEGAIIRADFESEDFKRQLNHWWGRQTPSLNWKGFRLDFCDSLLNATTVAIPQQAEVKSNSHKTGRDQVGNFLQLSQWLLENSSPSWKLIVPNGQTTISHLCSTEVLDTVQDIYDTVVVVSPLSPRLIQHQIPKSIPIRSKLHGRYLRLGIVPEKDALSDPNQIFERILHSRKGSTVVISAGGIGPKTIAGRLKREEISFLDLGASFNLALSVRYGLEFGQCADFTVDRGFKAGLERAQRVFFS